MATLYNCIGYWKKHFSDGEKEFGPDNTETTSWSKGRLDDIREVHLSDDSSNARLVLPNTEWHQFDRYELNLETGQEKRTLRIVQAKIQKEHLGFMMQYGGNDDFLIVQYLNNASETIRYPSETITENLLGKWATVVLPKNKKPYFLICNKGKYAN